MERLQKVIAQAGIASRRKAEEMIATGRVSVNGKTMSEMGYIVKKHDVIKVDGKPIQKENKVYYVMNKPKRSMCTSNDQLGRNTVVDLVDCDERIYCVGRLDYNTSGVLILTNDGEFANMIIHPRYHLPKKYNLTMDAVIRPDELMKLKKGIMLDDGKITQPAKVKIKEKDEEKHQTTLDITIYEGMNRQVRRMIEALGHNVTRLHRTKLGDLKVDDLSQGQYRILKPQEVKDLKNLSKQGIDDYKKGNRDA